MGHNQDFYTPLGTTARPTTAAATAAGMDMEMIGVSCPFVRKLQQTPIAAVRMDIP